MCVCGNSSDGNVIHSDYCCLPYSPKVDIDPLLRLRMQLPRFAAVAPDGRCYESHDGARWRVIQVRGPWRADECMAFGHEPDHDGLCARCCGRVEEAGE